MTHSHTAYAPEDVDDARRGEPSVSLDAWAASQGLSFPGSGLAGQLVTVLPRFPEYQFNVCRGELVPGRLGQVAHELHEIEAHEGSIRAGGAFFGTRVTTRRGFKSLIGFSDDRPDEPFAANAAWAPTTKVVLRVPEAALMPQVVIRNAQRMRIDHPDLAPHGMSGYRMAESGWISPELREWLALACAPLTAISASYVSLTLDHGLLAVARNGFISDTATLEHLVAVTATIAQNLASGAEAAPDFAAPLPPPDPATWPGFLTPQSHEVDAFARLADANGMVQEDAVALHRSFRLLPFPGVAKAVLRGPIPGTRADGRVVIAAQGGRTSGTYRTVVLAPAAPGATTPVGGVLHQPTDSYVEVSDGVAAGWPRTRTPNGFDSEASIGRAVAALRDRGLADL
ncbi:MAG: hypothetical protein H6528_10680 [Actinobacteria bacterium]|nr:hypothetical protein [Actinomycetota bacterium]MCB8997750.1 hypothetical protein [Actinomycetota bacterium]